MLTSPLSGLSSPVCPRLVVELAITLAGLISGLTGLISTLTRLPSTLTTSACGPKSGAHHSTYRTNTGNCGNLREIWEIAGISGEILEIMLKCVKIKPRATSG